MMRGAVFISTTGSGLPQPLPHMPYAFVTPPSEPGTIYAGLSNGDIWQGDNQGERWQQLPVHLGGIQRSLVMLQGDA